MDTLNPPSSSNDITKNFYNARDKNNITMTQLRSRIWSDGRVGTYLVARQGQTDLNNLYQNEIAAMVDAEGNRSYYVTDPAAFRTAIGAPGLTGVNVITGGFDRKFVNFDSKVASGWTGESANIIEMQDKNGVFVGQLRFSGNSDGAVESSLVARRGLSTDSGGIKQNIFSAKVNTNGDPVYYVSSPANFRTAIGLGYFGRLSGLSANKTLTTTATKMPLQNFIGNICTASSNGIKFNTTGSFMIWGAVYISTGAAQNDIIHVQLRVNDTNVLDQLTRCPGASPYEVFTVGPWIYYCSDASQVLSLYVYNQAQASGVATDSNSTNLMAVKVS